MKYLRKFSTRADYDYARINGLLHYPNVCKIDDTEEVIYHNEEDYAPQPDASVPLYVEALEDLTVSFSLNSCEYSLDNATWNSLPAGTSTPAIAAGSRVYLRASGLTPNSTDGIGSLSASAPHIVGGNILSMAHGEQYASASSVLDNNFRNFFYQDTLLKSASRLALILDSLPASVCTAMFYGCSSLLSAPNLPATSLSTNSYASMFYGCTSLENIQKVLPAMTLASNCYYQMYRKCSSLRAAPELPALNLADGCYRNMFYQCSSLVKVHDLPALSVSASGYRQMLGETNIKEPPIIRAEEYGAYACYYMFTGCKNLRTAPDLNGTTFTGGYCFGYMFEYCSNLTKAMDILPALTLKGACYIGMFQYCTSLEVAPILPATAWSSTSYNEYQQMFDGCSKLRRIEMYMYDYLGTSHTTNWVRGVAASGVFRKKRSKWGVAYDTNQVPKGWTVETIE